AKPSISVPQRRLQHPWDRLGRLTIQATTAHTLIVPSQSNSPWTETLLSLSPSLILRVIIMTAYAICTWPECRHTENGLSYEDEGRDKKALVWAVLVPEPTVSQKERAKESAKRREPTLTKAIFHFNWFTPSKPDIAVYTQLSTSNSNRMGFVMLLPYKTTQCSKDNLTPLDTNFTFTFTKLDIESDHNDGGDGNNNQTPNLLHQTTVLAELTKNIELIEENIQDRVQRLEDELANLKEKYERDTTSLKDDLKRKSFSIDRFKSSDTHFEFYTGFQNYDRFKVFYNFLSPACTRLSYRGSNNGKIESAEQQKRGRKRFLSPEEELFLVLTKLRCGLLERDLAARYNISVSQVSNIWITWLDFLYQRLQSIPIWPSRKHVDATMPASFKENFPQTRVVIDCTEMFIEMPSAPVTQGVTFSSYKHHNTAKGLVGISPAGTLTFVSELYAGRTSDKELTKDCGILKLLEEGDQIMADKGFLIEDCLPDGVTLNIPPFLKDQNQLSIEDEVKTRRIAKERIHVERAIEKIKKFQNSTACAGPLSQTKR
ncbi:Hypothetical predicted protein, partial [Paramuricea clavata]